jgi:tetratricopeptide (TPR) repeat protein
MRGNLVNKLVIGGLETLLMLSLASGSTEAHIPKIKPVNGLEFIIRRGIAQKHNERGVFLFSQRRYEEAISHFEKAIQKKPDYAGAYNNLGASYIQVEKFDCAISALEKAVELDQGYLEAHFSLGIAHYLNKDYDNALNVFTDLIGKNPNDTLLIDTYHAISSIFLEKGQVKDCAEALTAVATLYEKQGKIEDAIKKLNIAVEVYPDSASAHHNLAKIYAKKGMETDMAYELRELIRINADDFNAHWNLGIYYFKSGDYEQAIEECMRLIELEDNFQDAYMLMDISYNQMRRSGLMDKGLENKVKPILKDFWFLKWRKSNYSDSRCLDKVVEYIGK